jgi:SWIM zinc finger
MPPVPNRFDPTLHPSLVALGERLRELAGESAYAAGRDYFRTGAVKDGTVTGVVAQAVVRGSTDYRVEVTFGDQAKVACTCPAHRRKRPCKHVVALYVALLEQPAAFRVVARVEIPKAEPAPRKKRDGSVKQRAATLKADQQTAGLALVDRLLDELAAGGVAALGREQLALLSAAAETVRGLKLRHLGNLLMALRHLAEDGGDAGADPHRFAALLSEVYVTRRTLGAHAEGRVALEPVLAEELIGKTWRDRDLERVAGLELMPVAEHAADDGDFRVESTYLSDLATGELYVERRITPRGLRGQARPARRLRLLVDEAGFYPGESPRRIKLMRVRRAPLTLGDVDRVLARAVDDVAEVRRRLVACLDRPFADSEVAVVFRPAFLVVRGDRVGTTDAHGGLLSLGWPAGWTRQALGLLPGQPGRFALVGLASLGEDGLNLRCLGIVGALRWANGPTFPELG